MINSIKNELNNIFSQINSREAFEHILLSEFIKELRKSDGESQ